MRKNASTFESLESRILMSESASAVINLVSTTGTGASAVYNYNMTVNNTGTTPVGTFWFSWVPGQDFLPTAPLSESSPAGWGNAAGTSSTPALTGSGNSTDGKAIQWVAQSPSAAIAPGQSLGGFAFSTHDSPSALARQSPTHPAEPVLTSFVYSGAPLADPGFEFAVTQAGASGATASSTSLTPSASAVAAGDAATFTATVTSSTSGVAPTGTVTFLDNGSAIGSETLSGAGTASLTTSALPAGSDLITAQYGGDANFAASTSASITESVTAAPAGAGLVPTITKSTVPSALVAGASIHGAITLSVANQTGSAFKGSAIFAVYATTGGTIDGSATRMATITHHVNLAAGGTANVAVNIKSTPASLASGSYTLVARATPSAGSAADSAAGPVVTVAAPFIALSESFARLPSSLAAGATAHGPAALTFNNAGNLTSTGSTKVEFFLSADGAADSGATPIRSRTLSLHILPGKSRTMSFSLGKIPTVAAGSYFVVGQVTDPEGHVTTAVSGVAVNVVAVAVVRAGAAVGNGNY